MPFEIKYDKRNAEVYLGSAIVAFHQALTIAIEQLAEAKGLEDMSWFDRLRDNAIKAAKGTPTEQIPVEIEAAALGFAIEALDADFKSIRVRLLKKQD